jgi:uncharacterized protein (TIGR03067 family)
MRGQLSAGFAALVVLAWAFPALAQDAKKGTPELQGIWKLTKVERAGEEDEFPSNIPAWVIKGNQVFYGGELLATLTVDAKANPKVMDITYGDAKSTFEAIYAVDGDKLKVCVNRSTEGVKERPQDFKTKDIEGRRLLVFERAKPGEDDGTKNAPAFIGVQIGLGGDDKDKVIVVAALDKSPAKQAGVKRDDVILKVGPNAVTGIKQCVELIRAVRPGSDVTLHVMRGDQERDITIRARVIPFYVLDF